MLQNQSGKTSLLGSVLLVLAVLIAGVIYDAIQKANEREARCPERIVYGCQHGNDLERQANAELCAEYKEKGCW